MFRNRGNIDIPELADSKLKPIRERVFGVGKDRDSFSTRDSRLMMRLMMMGRTVVIFNEW